MLEKFTELDIILIAGNYNSGKSLIANKYFSNRKRINRNEIRRSMKVMMDHGKPWVPGDFNKDLEKLVKHMELMLYRYLLSQKIQIIIDNTSLNPGKRFPYIKEAQQMRRSIGCIFVDVPLDVLISRNHRRPEGERLPDEVLESLDATIKLPTPEEGFALVKVLSMDNK